MKFDPELNAMLALTIAMGTGNASEGLEAVEKAEQSRAQNECMLPKRMDPSKEDFEILGFVFEEVGDEVLYQAKLPEGWTAKTDGGYWTTFFDQKGRKRGESFYKGAFYDRDGYMVLCCSFSVAHEAIVPPDRKNRIRVFVKDCNEKEIYEAGRCKEIYSDRYFKLVKEAEKYLATNYPEWKDPIEYWD